MRRSRNNEESNFWAGYADCMLALFMIALLLWILSSGVTSFTSAQTGSKIKDLEEEAAAKTKSQKGLKAQLTELRDSLSESEQKVARLEPLKENSLSYEAKLLKLRESQQEILAKYENLVNNLGLEDGSNKQAVKELERKLEQLIRVEKAVGSIDIALSLGEENKDLKRELNDKPPIINLTEGVTKEFRFPSGKSVLAKAFAAKLSAETFPELKQILKKYRSIDTLEIVGHTDGSPIGRIGNLDKKIGDVLNNKGDHTLLTPGSNVDLGLMRALAIRSAWKNWLLRQPTTDQQRLSEINIRCYSAAQTVPPEGDKQNWLAADPAARRIEIRFTQLKRIDK